ncbi:MAG: AAA family ATPase [Clostridium sp.]
MKKELTPNEILLDFDLDTDKHEFSEIPEISLAYSKIRRALAIKEDGYNLYLISSFSNENISRLIKIVEAEYEKLEAPKDICYALTGDVKKPEPIFLSNGKANELKNALDDIKEEYLNVALEFYNSSSYKEKDDLINEIHDKRNEYISELVGLAKGEGFDVKATTAGFAFIPLKSGEAMTEKEYDELEKENKSTITTKASMLKKKAEVVLEDLKVLELDTMDKLREIYKQYLGDEMQESKEALILEFIGDEEVYDCLETIFKNLEGDIIECYSMTLEDDEEELAKVFLKYDISVLVDNSSNKHPQVIYEDDPSLTNLVGSIDYENHNGTYLSDLSLITPGSILKANEGCLIIRLSQLITNGYSYYYLKKMLMTGKVNLDTSKSYLELFSVNPIKPRPISFKCKIIIVGDYESYDILYNGDEDFKKLFPLRAEFAEVVDNEKISCIKSKILSRVDEMQYNEITEDALKEIIKHQIKLASHRSKMNIDEYNINKILTLANNLSIERGHEKIESDDIINVIYEDELIEKEIIDMFKDKKIILSISGEKVGSINGLAVLDTGYYSFGKPMRVTCITCKGDGSIIDVHKEANLSGHIHEKSLSILKSIISGLIDPYKKLSVDFHLSFEQVYGMLEGDSASVAEVVCMLSALSKRGIRQNIAVTGSLNQFKEVQAIGGVNEKIQGFYKVCKTLGESKGGGVLIPESNKNELILSPEVEKAINNGDFHIYTMESLEDAIEVLILNDGESYDDFIKGLKIEADRYKDKEIEKKNEKEDIIEK